jgi:Ca-activated chloride channel family protein
MRNARRIVALSLLVAALAGAAASRVQAQQATSTRPAWVPRDDVVLIVPQRRIPNRVENAAYLTAADARIDIKNQIATTTLTLSLTNPTNSAQQAEILMPIPEGVVVRSLQYDGVGPEPMASVLPKDEARRIYDEIVRRMRDPALVEFAGTNVIRTSAFPIPPNATQKLSLTFEQVLIADGTRVDYWLPRSDSLAASGVKWSIEGTISGDRSIASIYSPSHEVQTRRTREEGFSFRVIGASEADVERGSFRLSYLMTPPKDGLSWTMLAYPDSRVGKDGTGGYFMLMAALPPAKKDGSPVKREVTLVIDRSGSMRGEKMEQAKAAALQVLEGLDKGEAFNIIDYSDSINLFSPAAVIKDDKSMDEARAYVKAIEAGGGTNIHDSLAEALKQKPTKGMMPLVLFLTDGLPTVGERSEVRIREAAKKANVHNRRIFTFGVGFDVNSPLLSSLAKTSRAMPTFVLPKEDVEVKVSQVFKRLSGPLLGLPKLTVLDQAGTLGGSAIREILPREMPDLFDGDQLLVLGQYTTEGLIHVGLEGEFKGGHTTYTFTMDTRNATTRNGHVGRLWARAKVGSLIEEVREAGAEGGVKEARLKELTDEIVRLSTTWGILTEYTSFLAAPETATGGVTTAGNDWRQPSRLPAALRDDVQRKLVDRATKDRDGSAGVNQERNVADMDARAPQVGGKVSYYDAYNKEVEYTNIQQVADLTLLNRKNKWVDARILDQEDEKADVEVEFASEAYFTLVSELTSEGRQGILANKGDLYILHKNQRVLVRGGTQ